jgi:hypothetical protein
MLSLEMNWMALHGVTLDISFQAMEINSPSHGTTTLYLTSWECINFCAFTMEGVRLEDIPVVCKFADIFPDDLLGMPPDRDIEFIIELQPRTAPTSKRPYRLPPKELAELKIQLQELLDKGYIHPSASP